MPRRLLRGCSIFRSIEAGDSISGKAVCPFGYPGAGVELRSSCQSRRSRIQATMAAGMGKVIAGAKKEGEVRLWGDQEITHPDIVAAFSRQYPYIKVVTVTGRVGDLMPRIIAERRTGKYLADLS